MAADHQYLRTTLAETAAADADFTGRLLALLGTEPESASVKLNICRYDYFVNDQGGQKSLRMVEMNCIAASFACLSTRTSALHRYLATRHITDYDVDPSRLPKNNATDGMASAIARAHNAYAQLYAADDCVAVVVVSPGEKNAYDQNILRVAVHERGVEMYRVTLAEFNSYGSVDENHHLCLTMPSQKGRRVKVSVVYYRAGYAPGDYPTEKEWNARALIEKSLAAKCPSVAVQLVGTKKIQQVLDRPGEVERFVNTQKDADSIRATFARQYSLSVAEDGERIAQMAIKSPGDFVLKPQREGGGNNFYADDLKRALETMSPEERSAYVLMERIYPMVSKNTLLREGKPIVTDVVSEFGVYGVHIEAEGKILENGAAGTLLRSKAASQEDGGVAAGVAVLDSPLLVE